MKKYISKKRIIWGVLGILGILGVLGGLGGLKNKTYLVTKVIDGDTIEVKSLKFKVQSLISEESEDEIIKIRYIGIDAPELAKGKKKDECYAQKAKEISQHLVLGKEVKLEFDKNEVDRFGRYLAYVYTKDANAKNAKEEVFVNQYLLEKGAGIFFLDAVNLKYQDELIEAAEKGYKEKQGLWNDCAPDKNGIISPISGIIIRLRLI